jgi:hypothetical protein
MSAPRPSGARGGVARERLGLGPTSNDAFQQNIGMKKQERAQDHSQIDHVAGCPPIHPPVARSRRNFSAASLRSRAQDESYGAQDKNCRYVPVARVVRQLPARAPLHARPRTKMARKTWRGARDARVFGSGKGGKTLLLLTIQQWNGIRPGVPRLGRMAPRPGQGAHPAGRVSGDVPVL